MARQATPDSSAETTGGSDTPRPDGAGDGASSVLREPRNRSRPTALAEWIDLLRSRPVRVRAVKSLSVVVWAAASLMGIWIFAAFLRVALARFRYPYELEWMEGGMLMHVVRVLEGHPLYSEPSPEFMPFLYGPGYTYAAAAVAWLSEPSLAALRLLSLASTLGIVALLFVLVFTETKNAYAAVISSGLFVGTFELSGAWFDLARVDSFALFLSLTALVLIGKCKKPSVFALAGVIVALAVLTKQTMIVILPAALWGAMMFSGKRALGFFGVGFVVTLGGVVSVLEVQSAGWFSYYVMELPATHGMKGREYLVRQFWSDELPRTLPIAATCAVVFLSGFPLRMDRDRRLFYIVLCGALVVGAYLARLHMGSFMNDLMPAHAGMAIVLGLVLHGLGGHGTKSTPLSRASLRGLSCGVLALVQLLLLLPQDWARYVPGEADYRAGDQAVERIRSFPGDVLVVNHPHLAWLAGKGPYAHQMALIDVFEADRDPRDIKNLLTEKWAPLFEARHFSAVILDNDWYMLKKQLTKHYVQSEKLTYEGRELMPKTGTKFRPELILTPRAARHRKGN